MALKLDKVHHYVKIPGENAVKLIGTHPYIRFASEGQGVVFLQDGQFWYEGGQVLTDRPAWLREQIRKASPVALHEAGYDVNREKELEAEDRQPEVDQIEPPSQRVAVRHTTTVRRPTVKRS